MGDLDPDTRGVTMEEEPIDFDDLLPEERWTVTGVILISIAVLLLTWWFAVLFLSAFSERPLG